MITIYELKNKSFCRCFIRTPFYIKNLFLLLGLIAFLLFVQLVYFGKDSVYIKSITKILRGLNSDIFNFLSENREPLRMQPNLPFYRLQNLNSLSFMGECMRLNRPCVIENGVFDTPAFELWGFVNKSQYAPYTGEGAQNWLKPERAYAYLADKIGGKEVVVYDDRNPEKVTFGNPAFNTFKSESRARMTYQEFLSEMNLNVQGFAMRGDIQALDLIDDLPRFYFMEDITDIQAAEIEQGQILQTQPEYYHYEQIKCAIDGNLQIRLVPYIFRQEVYAGEPQLIKDIYSPEVKYLETLTLKPNQSPASFFDPDFFAHPNLIYIDADYYHNLKEGDCIYIPAFYFLQYRGLPDVSPQVGGMWPSSVSLTLKYKPNSLMLSALFSAVETKIVS